MGHFLPIFLPHYSLLKGKKDVDIDKIIFFFRLVFYTIYKLQSSMFEP